MKRFYFNLLVNITIILFIMGTMVVIRLFIEELNKVTLNRYSAQQKENTRRHAETITKQQQELNEFADQQREKCGEY